MSKRKKSWLIQGMDGLAPIFQRKLSSALSEKEICALLQRLAATKLTHDEVLDASLRRTMIGYKPLLEVKRELGRRVAYSCGENPHYVAALFDEHEFEDIEL